MRPVVRGEVPLNDKGNEKQFRQYQNARRDLIERLGGYCSYCEMKLDASLAVEHVQPKKHHATLERSWANFLLGCTNCNSTKSDKDVELAHYLWPDVDNTFRGLVYGEDGIVRPNPSLPTDLAEKANAMIQLVGLDKTPKTSVSSDRRWLARSEAWRIAERTKTRLQRNNNEDFREQVIETAVGHAYWSIWMTVFADDPDILCRLIEAFPGTASECFDDNGNPVPRPGGQL